MEDTVRKEAFYTLLDSGEYSSEEIDASLYRHQEWGSRDRSFYTALVETTLENQTTIDAIISAYSKTRLAKIRPVVRVAAEVALAQIFFMDRVPDSAACNESVKLVKAGGEGRYTGFTNGLIRNIIRNKEHIEARVVIGNVSVRLAHTDNGWKVTDPRLASYEHILDLSLTYSYPVRLVEHFEKSYGSAEQILKGLRAPRKTTALSKIPADELIEKLSAEGITAHALDDHAVVFEEGTHPAKTKEFHDGLFYIMDLSSMQPVYQTGQAGNFPDNAKVLDLCASPGGKSIEAAVLCDAHVTSCDISDSKTSRIQENIDRIDLSDRIQVMKNDATEYNPDFEGKYDVVIADVPCSALGVSGRKPDIRQRVTQQSMQDLAAIQRQILDNAAKYVKPGGTIIYSTCTLDPIENEQQVSAFLTASTEFTSVRQETIYPDEDHDGFFYAILSKR